MEKIRASLLAPLIILVFSAIQFAAVTWYMGPTYLYGKDSSWHLVNACLFSETLKDWPGLIEAHRILTGSEVTYPPLLYLASTIPQWIANNHEFLTILSTLAFFLFLLNLSIYLLARRLADVRAGIMALLFLALAPGLVGQLCIFNMTLPLAAMTALGLLALEHTRLFLDRRGSLLFGLAAGLAMLTYIYFALFLLVPVLYQAIKGVREGAEKTTAPVNLALAAFAALLIGSPYFFTSHFPNWLAGVTGHHLLGEAEVDAVAQSMPSVPFLGILWFYIAAMFNRLLGPVLALAACAGLIRLMFGRHPRALYLILCLLGPIVLHSLLSNAYSERLLPLAPIACLVLSLAISTIGRSGYRVAAVIFIAILALPFAWHRATYDRNVFINLHDLRFEDHMRLLSGEIEQIGDKAATVGTMYPRLVEFFSHRPEYSSLRNAQVHFAATKDFYDRFPDLDFLLLDSSFENDLQRPEGAGRTMIEDWRWPEARADRMLENLLHPDRTHILLLHTENIGFHISLYRRR